MLRFSHPARAARTAPVAVFARCLGLALFGLWAATAQAAEGDPKVPLEKYKLENGLEVILHPDNTVPLAYVSV
ncbi:MAG TPA: hypothetical protein VGF45_07100, partial [Polyangia bacterium]